MAGRLFDKLEQEAFRAGIAARTKASMNWFQDQVSTMSVSRPALIKDGPTRARQIYGMMYNFQYDPKTKKTLPYYDRFPLVIPIQPAKKGFHGMNLWQLLGIFLVTIGLIIMLQFIDPKNVLFKHFVWLLLILALGLMFYPMFDGIKDKSIILSAAFTTILITLILSGIAFYKPDLISFSCRNRNKG